MIVKTETVVDSSLLYLAVDLTSRPTLAEYGRQVDAMNVLWWHCVQLARARDLPPRRDTRYGLPLYVVERPPADITKAVETTPL